MPLYPNVRDLIRRNLEDLAAGRRAIRIAVGALTEQQHRDLNAMQAARHLPLSVAEVLFVGRHIYQRRIQSDGYTIDDVIEQIESAMSAASEVVHEQDPRSRRWATILRNAMRRPDRYGNSVRDEAVLECTSIIPNPDLFSVIPKGDRNRPSKRSTIGTQ